MLDQRLGSYKWKLGKWMYFFLFFLINLYY